MFILIVSRGFPSPSNVMNGNFEADQAKALTKLGHKVVVFSVDRRLRASDRRIGINHRVEEGIDVYNFHLLPMPIKTLYILGYFYVRLVAWLMSSYLIKYHGKPDIIHAHYLYTMPIAITLAKKFKVPCIGTEHWSYMGRDIMPKFVKFYAKRVYSKLDALVSVSNSLRNNILKHYSIRSRVIPNMIDASQFQSSNSFVDKNRIDTNFSFISIGALVDGKRFDLLIKSFSQLQDIKALLTIIGDGPKKTDLIKLASDLGVQDRVYFTGRLSRDKIIQYLLNSNVFALPSDSETFGVVYIEAMALGLPIIATRCGGPEDFVDSSNGLLIDRNSLDQLTEAMCYMIEHYSDYDKALISSNTINQFSSEKVAKQIESLYQDILANCIGH